MKRKLLKAQLDGYLQAGNKAGLENFLNEILDRNKQLESEKSNLEFFLSDLSHEVTNLKNRLRRESTETKKANDELQTLFKNIEDVFFSVDIRTKTYIHLSSTCEKLYGYPAEKFRDSPRLWFDLIHEEDQPLVRENIRQIERGESVRFEYRIFHCSGEERWVESKGIPTLQDGKLVRIDGFTTDISKRKFAEEKMHREELRFRRLIENSHDGIVLVGLSGEIIYLSPSIHRILGYQPYEITGSDSAAYTHPEDQEMLQNLLSSLYGRFGETDHAVYRMRRKDGSWCWVNANITNLLHIPDINAVVFNYKDITEKLSIEGRLEQERRNREALINSTKDLMWSFDLNFNMIAANTAFIEHTKVRNGVLLKPGDNLLEVLAHTPTAQKKWKGRYLKIQSGIPFRVVDHSIQPEEWWEVLFNPIRENGQVIGASCFMRDITAEKKATLMITASERLMSEAQRISHFGSWELRFCEAGYNGPSELTWSDEMYRIFGYPKERFDVDFEFHERHIHPDDKRFVKDSLEAAFEGIAKYDIEYKIITNTGELRWVRESAHITTTRLGKPLSMIGTVQDITAQKQAESERSKMASDLMQRNKDLEQFAYIISHNLRAPVANIHGLSTIIQTHSLDKESYLKCLQGLDTSVRRLDEIIIDLNNILQVKREVTEQKENVNFPDLMAGISTDLQHLIDREQVTINTNFEVLEVFTIKSYMYSIFHNLVSNSIKYRSDLQSPVINIVSEKIGDSVLLKFSDNGMGIDLKKHHDKIFGLYKRFHFHVEGKGIGLFMVKTQVETLGGRVSLKSSPGAGCEFSLLFEDINDPVYRFIDRSVGELRLTAAR